MASKRISINQQLCLSLRLYLLSLLETFSASYCGLDDRMQFLVGSRLFLLDTASRLDLRLIQLCKINTGYMCVGDRADEARSYHL
jgi:hypothetical protein